MKIILITLGIGFFSTLSFSQVENQTIISRYMEFYEYDQYSDKIVEIDAQWTETIMEFYNDYYYISIEGGERSKVYWEFLSRNEDGDDIYYTEDEYQFLFNYDDQEIYFYSEYDEDMEIYTNIIVLSKISRQ